jgi:DNA (cytosine-5)-methyltransferase 1
MRYFSMFSGIGGFEHAIQNAYRSKVRGEQEDQERDKGSGLLTEEGQDISTKKGQSSERITNKFDERPLPAGSHGQQQANTEDSREESCLITQGEQSDKSKKWRHDTCVGYSEVDKYAIKTYERRYDHKNYGDATKINAKELPDFDLLVGGFPCQAFSVAGKRAGFDDTRGTLFFDIARILKEKRPRHLVLENVKGLLSHDGGRTFTTIIGVLTDLGYCVEWQVLNSKNFGVPQNRERVFIIGHLRGECERKVFPLRSGNSKDNATHKESDVTRTITTAHAHGSSTNMSYIKQLNQPKHSNDRVYSDKGISPTLNTMQGGNRQPFIEKPPRIRRLTPVECERLQGFPDNWTSGESDTQRYKMCGNAVTTNVVQAVIERML